MVWPPPRRRDELRLSPTDRPRRPHPPPECGHDHRSGTVSNSARDVGSTCIAERRVIELLDHGAARTPFMQFGDRVRMEARWPGAQGAGLAGPFGVIEQRVVGYGAAG